MPEHNGLRLQAVEAARRLNTYMTAADLTGPDPYDGLKSPIAGAMRTPKVRQVLVQAVKRSPRDLRGLLRVSPTRMTKTLALVTSAFAQPGADEVVEGARARAGVLADELVLRASPEGGWGYEFDVQTRWGYYPSGSSNNVVTAFAVEALEDLRRPVPRSTVEYIASTRTAAGHFGYVAGSDVLIHNANLLACASLVRAGHIDGVASAVRRTLSGQQPDGLWPYGEGPSLRWVDNFHTVYVLRSLKRIAAALPPGDQLVSDINEALTRGVLAWERDCFDHSGAAAYLAGGGGPVDVHNVASALIGALELRGYGVELDRIHQGTLTQLLAMQGADGALRASAGGLAYMRWNQAHSLRALMGAALADV